MEGGLEQDQDYAEKLEAGPRMTEDMAGLQKPDVLGEGQMACALY